jgi:hypothetical protein
LIYKYHLKTEYSIYQSWIYNYNHKTLYTI